MSAAERERLLMVVIPCLDEERTVGHVIAGIPERIDGIGRVEVLVIDDGSSDNTAKIAREAGAITSDFRGGPPRPEEMVAAAPGVHAALLRLLDEAGAVVDDDEAC